MTDPTGNDEPTAEERVQERRPLPLREPPPSRFVFPDPRMQLEPGRRRSRAESSQGVLCVGGDFAPGTLLAAYRRGIFPWPVSEEMVPWCSPDPRAVFPLETNPRERWGSSMNRARRRPEFCITFDEAFLEVMEGCGDRDEGTWIVNSLVEGFLELHERGFAHSIEVWNRHSGELVGGLYGLAVGGLFAGESMFSRERDASKHAFAHLTEHLFQAGFRMLDAQVMNPHLATLGMQEIPRDQYLDKLPDLLALHPTFPTSPR